MPGTCVSKKVLCEGKNCREIFDVRRSGLIVDGRDYYLAFYLAARRARRYILISGWQFDTDVKLLRGEDAQRYTEEAGFLGFLNALCERNPELRIYLLAWDFSIFFALEREWFQQWRIKWQSNPHLHFRFDKFHAAGASIHQKFVVIDNAVAFVGGADICAHRWDDRCHRSDNPERKDDGDLPYGPYHETQAYIEGPAVSAFSELFRQRWLRAGGENFSTGYLATPDSGMPEGAMEIASNRAALSRTLSRTFVPLQEPVSEIRELYIDAISSADRLIYIENQYLSSYAVYRALAERLSSAGRRLNVVIILPKDPVDFSEGISVGVSQAKILRSLTEIASERGHSFGAYYSVSSGEKDAGMPVYIHSKLLIIDDRFLSVGSANMTNRSLSLDPELNLSWEADPPGDRRFTASVRRIRVSLLAEHAGLRGYRACRRLRDAGTLVEYLDSLVSSGECRLCRHEMGAVYEDSWLRNFGPLLDPSTSIEENLYEFSEMDSSGLFAKGITVLNALLQKTKLF